MGDGLFRVFPILSEFLLDSCENILWWPSDSRQIQISTTSTWASFLKELLPRCPRDTHGAAEIWTCGLFICAGSVIRRYHTFRFPHGDPKDRTETGIREGRSNEGLRGPLPHLMLRGGARDDSIQFQSRRRDSPGRQQGTMNPDVRQRHGTGENDMVLDMRTDEEIALLQSMVEKPAEPAVEISTAEYPESRRAAYLREQALKMIPDFVAAWPEGNTSTVRLVDILACTRIPPCSKQ